MVYVCSFESVTTGGVELLHQLVFTLNQVGVDAKMVYVQNGYPIEIVDADVTERYREYNVETEADLAMIDREGNVVVVPEVMFDLFGQIKCAKKVAWWLSINNYVSFVKKIYSFTDEDLQELDNLDYYFFHERDDVFHLVQSHYAMHYLQKNLLIPKEYIDYLSDYLNEEYLSEEGRLVEKRVNVVLYNPAKGKERTERLISEMKDEICWIPLQDLSQKGMREHMRRAKVYIDFGNHPGKDRIPREAAISGCCVITGRQGAAAYEQDVPIPEKYKIDDLTDIDVPTVKALILDIFENYEERTKDFDSYREMIRGEKEKFVMDVMRLFR